MGSGLITDDQRKAGDVEISVGDDEELSQAQLKKRYEEQQAQQNRVHVPGANADRSGFDDVVAGETQKRARKAAAATKGKEKEKEKFKF
jgi:splicing factor 3B subunit 2